MQKRQIFQYHPVIGWHYIPGLKTRVDHEGGGYLVSVNSAGFRSHEITPEPPPGKFRILLFGDSITAGHGVSDSRRYGNVLEKNLPDTEILNFGLCGSGTDQQYLIFREFGSQLKYDMVIITSYIENIQRTSARYRVSVMADDDQVLLAKPYFVRDEAGELSLHHQPVPKDPIALKDVSEAELEFAFRGGRLPGLRKIARKLGVKELAQRVTRYQPLPQYSEEANPEWVLLEAVLRKWISEITSPVLICTLPVHQLVEQTCSDVPYQKHFEKLADPAKVTVHDMLPTLRSFTPEERRAFRFKRDIHPTPSAHAVYAEELAPLIESIRG